MSKHQSLADLKAENAEPEAEESATPQEVDDTEEEEAVEVETEEPEEEAETPEGEPVPAETEAWMGEETDNAAPKEVPLSTLQSVRSKLKGKNNELKGENSDLRNEIDQLKAQMAQGQQPQVTQAVSPVMPKLEDFEYDEGKYQEAMSKHYNGMIDARMNQTQQSNVQAAAVQKQAYDIQQKSDEHYRRAQELVTKHGINPEVYGQADRKVREAIEQVLPNQGDATTDRLISIIGEGSEKVLYAIGRNEGELDKVRAKLISDPTGLSLAVYLGQKNAEFSMPAKKKSNAPKPARQISGKGTKDESKNISRRYKDAKKKGDIQGSFNARMEARRAGINTQDW